MLECSAVDPEPARGVALRIEIDDKRRGAGELRRIGRHHQFFNSDALHFALPHLS